MHVGNTVGRTNGTAVRVRSDVSFIGGAAKSIKVKATNGCSNSLDKTLAVTRLLPLTPGTITGPSDPCPIVGTPTKYAIRKVANATGYTWGVPSGASFTHENATGINDTAIFITWTAAYTGGNVPVIATNNCWSSAAKTCTPLRKHAATPGTIQT